MDPLASPAAPPLVVRPPDAARAYRQAGGDAGAAVDGTDFGSVLNRAVEGVASGAASAEAQSMQAIAGGGDITAVVTAVNKAELALQTTVAIRDRVVQAYQDIMKMPI